MHDLIQLNQHDEDIHVEYNTIKQELEQIERHKAKGVILRSKCKWAEDGEKSTAYFLTLDKHNFSNKLITQIEFDGTLIKEQKEILNAEKNGCRK